MKNEEELMSTGVEKDKMGWQVRNTFDIDATSGSVYALTHLTPFSWNIYNMHIR